MAVAGDCQALVRRPRDVRHDVCSLRVGARGPMEPGVHVEPAELPADCSDARADGGVLEALFEADGAERGARLAMRLAVLRTASAARVDLGGRREVWVLAQRQPLPATDGVKTSGEERAAVAEGCRGRGRLPWLLWPLCAPHLVLGHGDDLAAALDRDGTDGAGRPKDEDVSARQAKDQCTDPWRGRWQQASARFARSQLGSKRAERHGTGHLAANLQ